MNFENLNDAVRELMVDEIEVDISNERIYVSPRLTDHGVAQYPELLVQAASQADEEWLAGILNSQGLIRSHEWRTTRGKRTQVKVPHTAAQTLAEGEFNRYYVRALCRFAIDNEQDFLEVYRAKEVRKPRSSSIALIGKKFSPKELLADLRENRLDTVLGIPPGPNSGLSVKLPA